MEPTGGRREYDSDHVDPATRNFVEERLRETRHEFRNEVEALRLAITNSALQQTREHGEVRSEIQGIASEVAAVRRDLAVVLPLPETVAQLAKRDEIEEARTEAIDKLRFQQRWVAMFLVAAVPAAIVVAPHIN